MQEIKNVYNLKIKTLKKELSSESDIETQKGSFVVYDDNSIMGYIRTDSKISHILTGIYIENVGLLVRAFDKNSNGLKPIEYNIIYNDDYYCFFGKYLLTHGIKYDMGGTAMFYLDDLEYDPDAEKKVTDTIQKEIESLNPYVSYEVNESLLKIKDDENYLLSLRNLLRDSNIPSAFFNSYDFD